MYYATTELKVPPAIESYRVYMYVRLPYITLFVQMFKITRDFLWKCTVDTPNYSQDKGYTCTYTHTTLVLYKRPSWKSGH